MPDEIEVIPQENIQETSSSEVEAAQEQIIPPDIEEQVSPKLAELEEAAGIKLSDEQEKDLLVLIAESQGKTDDEQQAMYKEMFQEHPDIILPLDKLDEVSDQILKPGIDDKEESPEKLQENAENLLKNAENGTIRQIQKKIKEIMSDDRLQPDQKEVSVREYLQSTGLSPDVTETIVTTISSDLEPEQRQQQVDSLIQQAIEANPKVVENVVDDIQDVKRLMDRISDIGADRTRTEEYRELYNSMNKATEELVEQIPMEDFIDMVFAVGHGYGGFRGGRYDRWGEKGETDKEKETLKVLGEIFDEDETPNGTKEFFASLTDSTPDVVFSDASVLRSLESMLNTIETSQNPEEARKEMKEKISRAVEAAGKKLEADKMNLSPDVLKYILIKAKENLKK